MPEQPTHHEQSAHSGQTTGSEHTAADSKNAQGASRQACVPHPDSNVYPNPSPKPFACVPERLWNRAFALGWRDVPWAQLSEMERVERVSVPGDEDWMARRYEDWMKENADPQDHARDQIDATLRNPLRDAITGLSVTWADLFEHAGGIPLLATSLQPHEAMELRREFVRRQEHMVSETMQKDGVHAVWKAVEGLVQGDDGVTR